MQSRKPARGDRVYEQMAREIGNSVLLEWLDGDDSDDEDDDVSIIFPWQLDHKKCVKIDKHKKLQL